jgi:hypothetical protein
MFRNISSPVPNRNSFVFFGKKNISPNRTLYVLVSPVPLKKSIVSVKIWNPHSKDFEFEDENEDSNRILIKTMIINAGIRNRLNFILFIKTNKIIAINTTTIPILALKMIEIKRVIIGIV